MMAYNAKQFLMEEDIGAFTDKGWTEALREMEH